VQILVYPLIPDKANYLGGLDDGVVRCDLQLIYMSFVTCSVVWFCIIVLAVIEIWKKAKPSLQMCQRPGPAAPIESFEVSGAPEVAPPFDIEVAIAKDRPSLVCAPWKGPPLKEIFAFDKQAFDEKAKGIQKASQKVTNKFMDMATTAVARPVKAIIFQEKALLAFDAKPIQKPTRTESPNQIVAAPKDPAEAEAAEADEKPEAPPSAAAPAPSPAAELPVKDETVDDDEPAVKDPTPILLSSWYPSIGFPALLLFIMPFLSPEWAHPLPEPDFDAITRFTPCTSHLHCGKIKTCPGEGMKELEGRPFCWLYGPVPPEYNRVCWITVPDTPGCQGVEKDGAPTDGYGVACQSGSAKMPCTDPSREAGLNKTSRL